MKIWHTGLQGCDRDIQSRGLRRRELTGKIEKYTLSGMYTEDYTAVAGSILGTFSLTLAADNQSFMGSKYNYYGPDASFPPPLVG
jgi:hypothetical protein